MRFVRDLCCDLCADCTSRTTTHVTDPNRVKLAQKSEFVRERYVILTFGLCDVVKHVGLNTYAW